MAVRFGDATNDSLNALVLLAGLSWREVDVLRAYAAYAFQLGAVPSRRSLPTALVSYPNIARVFFDIFEAKFDPEGPVTMKDREVLVEDLRALLTQLMTSVTLLADDRALRRIVALLDATVRTNYFRNGGRSPTRRSGGVPYISLKLSARTLDLLRYRADLGHADPAVATAETLAAQFQQHTTVSRCESLGRRLGHFSPSLPGETEVTPPRRPSACGPRDHQRPAAFDSDFALSY